jgi:hypothetical protein
MEGIKKELWMGSREQKPNAQGAKSLGRSHVVDDAQKSINQVMPNVHLPLGRSSILVVTKTTTVSGLCCLRMKEATGRRICQIARRKKKVPFLKRPIPLLPGLIHDRMNRVFGRGVVFQNPKPTTAELSGARCRKGRLMKT